jgi:hypothetical protein
MRRFAQTAAIDWSGAVSERPPGIAVATAQTGQAPVLITSQPRWSRQDVTDWLLGHAAAQSDLLIGCDFSFALPFADTGSYFPEWNDSPGNAPALWARVEAICRDDPHLSVTSFVSHPTARRHFRHGNGDTGDLFTGGIGRLRRVEAHQRATRRGNSASCFNLVGAAQVGKASLTGMRMLNRLHGKIPIWPFDRVPQSGPMLVEIYTSVAALAAGRPPGKSKVRDRIALAAAFAALDHPCPALLERYDDHSTDALLTAAWLLRAQHDVALWSPPLMDAQTAQKEGWTFGII